MYVETHRTCVYPVSYLSLNLLQKQGSIKICGWGKEERGRKGKQDTAADLCLAEDKGIVFPDYLFF